VLTLALYGLLAVVVIGVLYLVAARLLPAGEQIAPPVRDEPLWALPSERPLVAADVAEVRLPVALRGYRFAETDLLLDRLVEELRARDEEIARLRGEAPVTRAGQPDPAPGARFQPPPEPVVGSSPSPSPSPAPAASHPSAPPPAASRPPASPLASAPTPAKSAPTPAKSAPTPADEPGKSGSHGG
jgi:hypothetical protein